MVKCRPSRLRAREAHHSGVLDVFQRQKRPATRFSATCKPSHGSGRRDASREGRVTGRRAQGRSRLAALSGV